MNSPDSIRARSRTSRLSGEEEVEAFAEELEDRFGPPPPETQALLLLARLRALALAAGVVKIDAGPKAVAFSSLPGADLEGMAAKASLTISGDRLLRPGEVPPSLARAEAILSSLRALAA